MSFLNNNRYNQPKNNKNKRVKLKKTEQPLVITEEHSNAFYDMCGALADISSAILTLQVSSLSPLIAQPVKDHLRKVLGALNNVDLNLVSVLGTKTAEIIKNNATENNSNLQLQHVKRMFLEAPQELRDHLEILIEDECSNYSKILKTIQENLKRANEIYSHLLDKRITGIVKELWDDEKQNHVVTVSLSNNQNIKLYFYNKVLAEKVTLLENRENCTVSKYIRHLFPQPVRV